MDTFVNGFFNGVFSVVMSFSSALLVGPIGAITSAFPSLGGVMTTVIEYFTTILKFVPLALDFCMIPRSAMVFLFDYYVIKYGIYLITRVIKLLLNIYRKFKP